MRKESVPGWPAWSEASFHIRRPFHINPTPHQKSLTLSATGLQHFTPTNSCKSLMKFGLSFFRRGFKSSKWYSSPFVFPILFIAIASPLRGNLINLVAEKGKGDIEYRIRLHYLGPQIFYQQTSGWLSEKSHFIHCLTTKDSSFCFYLFIFFT